MMALSDGGHLLLKDSIAARGCLRIYPARLRRIAFKDRDELGGDFSFLRHAGVAKTIHVEGYDFLREEPFRISPPSGYCRAGLKFKQPV